MGDALVEQDVTRLVGLQLVGARVEPKQSEHRLRSRTP